MDIVALIFYFSQAISDISLPLFLIVAGYLPIVVQILDIVATHLHISLQMLDVSLRLLLIVAMLLDIVALHFLIVACILDIVACILDIVVGGLDIVAVLRSEQCGIIHAQGMDRALQRKQIACRRLAFMIHPRAGAELSTGKPGDDVATM